MTTPRPPSMDLDAHLESTTTRRLATTSTSCASRASRRCPSTPPTAGAPPTGSPSTSGRPGSSTSRSSETGGHPIVYADWLHADGAPTVARLRPLRRPAGRSARRVEAAAVRAGRRGRPGLRPRRQRRQEPARDLLQAAEALLATRGRLPVNLRFVFEGEEESRSDHLEPWLEANRDRLGGDVALISDVGFFEGNLPAHHDRPARASCTPRSTSSARSRTSTPGSTAGSSPTRPTRWPGSSRRSRTRTARIRIPGFYDDVVPLDDGRAGGVRRAAVRRGGLPGRLGVAGARRRGRLHDARAQGGPADPRRQRHLGRLPGRGHQDDHPGPRPRQGQLPARRRPGPGRDLRAPSATTSCGSRRPASRSRSRNLGSGRPTLTSIDHPAVQAAGPGARGDLRPGPALHPRGRLDPVRRHVRGAPRPAGRAHGLHAARRQLPRPQRVDGPGQLRGRDPDDGALLGRAGGASRVRARGGRKSHDAQVQRCARYGASGTIRGGPRSRCYDARHVTDRRVRPVSIEQAEETATPKGAWRLDTANGSMTPAFGAGRAGRPQRQGHHRQRRRVPAGPARLHAPRQDHRHGPAGRRAAAHRRRPGHRQDHDGAPDGAQRRLGRPGQRAVHLLRARGAVPAQPAHRDGVGARAPAPQDRRDQDPGRPQGDPRQLDGRRHRGPRSSPTTRACARRSTGSPATARTCSSCAARRPRAPSTTCASSSSSTSSCRAIAACSSSSTTCRRCRSSPSRRPSRRR